MLTLLLGRSGAGGGAGLHRAAAVSAHPRLRPRAALPGLHLAPRSRPPAPRHRRHPLHPPRQHTIAHISVSRETRFNHNMNLCSQAFLLFVPRPQKWERVAEMSSSAKRVYRDAVVPRRGRVRAPLPVRWVTSASGQPPHGPHPDPRSIELKGMRTQQEVFYFTKWKNVVDNGSCHTRGATLILHSRKYVI